MSKFGDKNEEAKEQTAAPKDEVKEARESKEPKVMADSEKVVPPAIQEGMSVIGAGGNERVLSKEDFDRMDVLLTQERTAIIEGGNLMIESEMIRNRIEATANKAMEARKERDKFCLELEKKYDVPPGHRWTFDYNKRAIIITPTKSTFSPSS